MTIHTFHAIIETLLWLCLPPHFAHIQHFVVLSRLFSLPNFPVEICIITLRHTRTHTHTNMLTRLQPLPVFTVGLGVT